MNKKDIDKYLEKDLIDLDINQPPLSTKNKIYFKLGYRLGFVRADDIWYNADKFCDRCGVVLKEMNNLNEILIDTLEKLSKIGNGDKLGNSDGNVIAQKGLAKYYEALENPNTIEDGFGNSWSIICPLCNDKSMQVMRPGKVQCSNCG